MSSKRRGLLFIVSAPSGTGKTTLVERLVQVLPNLRMSRSYTSRIARDGERDGVDYNFVSREEFERRIANDEFLEWADVFGNYYGTCASDVEGWIADGQDVVLVIDVQGARQVKARQFDHTSIFVLPPSFEVLEHRLRGRSKDTEEQMQRRLATARAEASSYVDYDYVVVNDALEPTVTRLQEIIAAERSRTYRMKPLAESIIQSFLQKPINTEARKTHGDSEKTRNTKPRKHGSAEKDGATEKTRNTEARRGAETRRKTETRRGHGDRETRRH